MVDDSKELAGVAKRKPPSAGRGRKKGEVNKTTRALKEAILLAAEEHGEDDNGKGGLTGYLRKVAREDVKAFSGLLGRVLPLQVEASGKDGTPLVIQWKNADS
jgi:hypothetical protein